MDRPLTVSPDKTWDEMAPGEVGAILAAREAVDTYEFQYRKRYGIPPGGRKLEGISLAEMIQDYWEHRIDGDPDLRATDFHAVFKGRPEVPE